LTEKDDKQETVEYLVAMAKLTGAACSTVSDGHVIVMRKDKLQSLLDKEGEVIVIFVKNKPDVLK
jgi:hypothetical protein